MIILDTNVASALMDVMPNQAVVAWLDRQPRSSVWVTAITVFELQYGLSLLPESRKRRELEAEFRRVVIDDLKNRVLEFDAAAATAAGILAAERRLRGTSKDVPDTQIAGIVLSRVATLATRNVKHFDDIDARIVNPWADED